MPTRTSTTWIYRGLIPQTRVTRLFAVRRDCRTVGLKVGVQVRCAAAANADGFERPPASKEQAFEQARTAIEYVVATRNNANLSATSGGKKKKIKAKVTGKRVAVELPLADESPKEMATLVVELLKNISGRTVVYCGTAPYAAAVAAAGCPGDIRDMSVAGSMEVVPVATDLLLFVGVQSGQIGALRTVSMRAPACPVVLVNAEWDPSAVPGGERAFVDTFQVIYSLTPLAIQGLMKNSEGAVFKCATSAPPSTVPWLVYWNGEVIKEDMARPSPVELEQILYNKAAEDSALVKAAEVLRKLNPFAKK